MRPKIYPKNIGTPVTNKEAFEYLNERNENLSLLIEELDLDLDEF